MLLGSNVQSIGERSVRLEQKDKLVDIDNDAVVVSAGGILPTGFLTEIGIKVETKHGAV